MSGPSLITKGLMRVVSYSRFGNPTDVLEFAEVPAPPAISPATPYDVQIKIMAVSINPIDTKRIEGKVVGLVGHKLPFIPGYDVAGIVQQVGDRCSGFQVGDEVIAFLDARKAGGLAEYANVKYTSVVKKPAILSMEQAATIPIAGVTVLDAIKSKAELGPGEKILIVGASGGTGSFAVQVAKAYGANVTATCSTKNVDFVRRLGADRVIDYTQEKWEDILQNQDYDVVLDLHGGANCWNSAKKIMRERGSRFVTIVGDDPAKFSAPTILSQFAKTIARKVASFSGGPSYSIVLPMITRHKMEEMNKLIESQKVKPQVDRVYRMEEFKQAFEYLRTGHPSGKVVITVAPH